MPYIPSVAPSVRPVAAPPRAPSGRRHPRRTAAVAAAVVAALVVALVLLIVPAPGSKPVIVVLHNIDSTSMIAEPAAVAAQITTAAQSIAANGGTLVDIAAAGSDTIVRTTDLTVHGPDGAGIEPDPSTRNAEISRRVTQAQQDAASLTPVGDGRGVVTLLRAAESYDPSAVYYIGFGLGTVGAADAGNQMHAIDAPQAVREVADQLPDLSGAQLTVLFTAANGDQKPLSIPSRQWRAEWWSATAAATHAGLVDTQDVAGTTPPASAADAPAIDPLPDDADPHNPQTTVTATTTATETQSTAVTTTVAPADAQFTLADAAFIKETSALIDPTATANALQAWVAILRQSIAGYTTINCIGRTALYGPATGALSLSQERAQVVADLLAPMLAETSITVTPDGHGYDDPVPGGDDAQRTVICTAT